MITLEDVRKNEEVQALIEGTRETIRGIRLYRTFYKAHKYSI